MEEVWITGVVPATMPPMVKFDSWKRREDFMLEYECVLARVSIPPQVLGHWYICAIVSSF